MTKVYQIWKYEGYVDCKPEELENGMITGVDGSNPEVVKQFNDEADAKKAFESYNSEAAFGDDIEVTEYELVSIDVDDDGEEHYNETLNTSEYKHLTLWSVDSITGRETFDKVVQPDDDFDDVVYWSKEDGRYNDDEHMALVKDIDGKVVAEVKIPGDEDE